MRALVSLGQRPCWMEPVSCSSFCSQKCWAAPGAEGQMDRFRCTAVPCSLETGTSDPGESPRARGMGICGWWFKGGIFSEAPSFCSSSQPPQQACPLSPPQVHPMTPSLGATPDEAQLPAGPPAHRGGHIWAVPSPVGLAIWGADFGSGSPWGVGPGLGSFPRGPSSPSSLLSHCCKYFNEMEKKKTKKKKKISSLEATGSLQGPASPSFLRSRAAPLGLAARTSLCTCASPARVGRPPEQLFTIQRQKKNLDTTAKQRTRFLPSTCFCRLFPCSACPWHQSALLGRVPHCLPQDWGLSSPLPTGPGEAPHTPKDAFAKMAVLSL